MKQTTKQQLTAKKHRAIYKQYETMLRKNIPVDKVYKSLVKRFFLDQGSIYRVVLAKKGIRPPGKKLINDQ
jgi:hypothetical protein